MDQWRARGPHAPALIAEGSGHLGDAAVVGLVAYTRGGSAGPCQASTRGRRAHDHKAPPSTLSTRVEQTRADLYSKESG